MSDKKEGNSGSSMGQLLVAILGTVLGFTLLLALLANFFNDTPVPEDTAAIKKADANIQPVATVEVAAASTEHVEKSGEEVVKAVCAMCHEAGLMNAPKIGDAGQWGPRNAQGYDALVKNAINGIRGMPARGGNADLTDAEVAKAVAFMANKGGANFDPASLAKK